MSSSFNKVLVTGISGAGVSEALRGLCKDQKGLVHSDLGRLVEDVAREAGTGLTAGNVLKAPIDTLSAIGDAAFQRLLSQMSQAAGTQLVDCHATFLLTTGLVEGIRPENIEKISPDLFLTIIDGPGNIHKRLREDPRQYFQLTIADIVKWQEFEVYITNLHARQVGKRHLVIPFAEAKTIILALLNEPEGEVVYASYPMTNLLKEYEPQRDKFLKELKKCFIVFNPGAIESAHDRQSFYSIEDHLAIESHTITRDLNWFIRLNEASVVAYMPPGVFSSGSNDELRFAYETGRQTYIVLDTVEGAHQSPPRLSPFTTYKAMIFRSQEEFFKFCELPKGGAREAYRVALTIIQASLKMMADNDRVTPEEFRKTCKRYFRYHLSDKQYSNAEPKMDKIVDMIYRSWVENAVRTPEGDKSKHG